MRGQKGRRETNSEHIRRAEAPPLTASLQGQSHQTETSQSSHLVAPGRAKKINSQLLGTSVLSVHSCQISPSLRPSCVHLWLRSCRTKTKILPNEPISQLRWHL